MPSVQPISVNRHQAKRWQRYSDYSFAAKDAVCPVVPLELPRAMLTLPIGFFRSEEGVIPVAVQGLEPGHNFFVSPQGQWRGDYIPAFYRGYPFSLAGTAEGGQLLCIDEDSGLLSDEHGEAFFEEGKPSKALADILTFLNQINASHRAGLKQCALLEEHGLMRPWTIKLDTEHGERQIGGLYCIDEKAFKTLTGAALLELRDAGVMPLIYCQMLSMQHLLKLARMSHGYVEARQQHALELEAAAAAEADRAFLNEGGTISFGALG